MHDQQQKKAFLETEADNWFTRNQEALSVYDPAKDCILHILKQYSIPFKNVLEIGCSEGYRLSAIQSNFPQVNAYGVDPSGAALASGMEKFPGINLRKGTIDDLGTFPEKFDLVIVGFVFYVVDRSLIFKTLAEIDRVLADNGFLVIMDFYTNSPVKRPYEHIKDFPAFTYKQHYEELFTASHLYHLLHKSTYHHSTMKDDVQSDFQEMVSVSLLKKNLKAAY
jgi:ubiquinone/menaquinone biosynthesis C-methylase UbiE